MELFLDHVALLVKNLESALRRAQAFGLQAGPIEEFPSEGTREVYLGTSKRSARLLLMQPLGDKGPYVRALRKRGPGLHHLAIALPEPKACLPGWLVHPASLEGETIWLARPGVPTLFEVSAGVVTCAEPVVERVEIPVPRELERLFDPLADVGPSPDEQIWLALGGERVALATLLG